MIDERYYPMSKGGQLSRHTAGYRYDTGVQRFKFTDETSHAMGKLFGEMPEALLHNYQFALPPYPKLYTEFDLLVFLEALAAPKTSDLTKDPTKTSGYLSVNGMVTILSGNPGYAPMHSFHCYCIDAEPHPPAYRPPYCKRIFTSRDTDMPILALGSTFMSPHMTEEIVTDLNGRVSFWMENWVKSPALGVLKEFVGDVRNWWAMMLWLNQPSSLVYDIVPRQRKLTKRGHVVHQPHTLVRLRPGKTYHHVAKGFFKRAAPGGHEVREFFRHYDKTPSCVHQWPLYPNEDGAWQCAKCPEWMVRVASFKRGDWSRPVTRKGYVA